MNIDKVLVKNKDGEVVSELKSINDIAIHNGVLEIFGDSDSATDSTRSELEKLLNNMRETNKKFEGELSKLQFNSIKDDVSSSSKKCAELQTALNNETDKCNMLERALKYSQFDTGWSHEELESRGYSENTLKEVSRIRRKTGKELLFAYADALDKLEKSGKNSTEKSESYKELEHKGINVDKVLEDLLKLDTDVLSGLVRALGEFTDEKKDLTNYLDNLIFNMLFNN